MTSSRISDGLSRASSAPVTASIVPGAISCPCSIRSTSSPTTVSADRTSPGSPSRVSTLPRRYSSQPRCPSSARSTASSEPASSVATVLSSVNCLRAKPRAHRLADPLAVRAPMHLGHHGRHHLSHLLRALRPALLDRGPSALLELVVAELPRQVGLDHIALGALGARLLVAAAASVGLRGLEPLLALALQHRDLVAVAELRVLLERVRDQAQRRNAIALAAAHPGLRVLLHPLPARPP